MIAEDGGLATSSPPGRGSPRRLRLLHRQQPVARRPTAVSLRTSNRNFEGRSRHQGRPGLPGQPRDGRGRGHHRQDHRPARRWSMELPARSSMPSKFLIDDSMFICPPAKDPTKVDDLPRARTSASRPPDDAAAGDDQRRGHHQGGRQDHHRPHHPGGRPDEVPLQRAQVLRVRVRERGPEVLRAGASRSETTGKHNVIVGGASLRPGLLARARGPLPDVPGRQGGAWPSPSSASTPPT